MNAKKHTPLSLHGLRLLFPPLATLGILFLTEWIARGSLTGENFTQYIFPHAEAYLLAWAMLFLSWLAVDWLTRFAPLATLLAAVLGCAPAAVNFYTLQLRPVSTSRPAWWYPLLLSCCWLWCLSSFIEGGRS